MSFFIGKPEKIEAKQYDGTFNTRFMLTVWGVGLRLHEPYESHLQTDPQDIDIWVVKSKTWVRCAQGTWIIKERDGIGYYPCSPEIFDEKYTRLLEYTIKE